MCLRVCAFARRLHASDYFGWEAHRAPAHITYDMRCWCVGSVLWKDREPAVAAQRDLIRRANHPIVCVCVMASTYSATITHRVTGNKPRATTNAARPFPVAPRRRLASHINQLCVCYSCKARLSRSVCVCVLRARSAAYARFMPFECAVIADDLNCLSESNTRAGVWHTREVMMRRLIVIIIVCMCEMTANKVTHKHATRPHGKVKAVEICPMWFCISIVVILYYYMNETTFRVWRRARFPAPMIMIIYRRYTNSNFLFWALFIQHTHPQILRRSPWSLWSGPRCSAPSSSRSAVSSVAGGPHVESRPGLWHVPFRCCCATKTKRLSTPGRNIPYP